MGENVERLLTRHWGMDTMAAGALAATVTLAESERIVEVADSIPEEVAAQRDRHRISIGASYTRQSNQKVMVEGPCSIDWYTQYNELFDVIEFAQDENPDATIGVRINGIKPRTTYGWRGMGYSLDPKRRQRLHNVHREAMVRGLPIFSEITVGHELGEFAPYLSSVWLGAMGMASTALRSDVSLFGNIPFATKNGHDGSIDMVENALIAAGANSELNEESGVNIGTIASGPQHRGIPTGVLPVGKGNFQSAIMARGYSIEKDTPPEIGTALALEHISKLCTLAKKLGTVVLIDKTHGAPIMIGLDRKDSDRILKVNETIWNAMETGQIQNAEYIGGEIAEVGTEKGETDPNHIISWKRRHEFSDMIGRTLTAIPTEALAVA